MATLKISRELQQQIETKATNYILRQNPEKIISQFEKIKQKLIIEFLNHPVTKEINAGPYASNTSATLSNITNGNLFSFIGFELGTNPTQEILDEFEKIEIKLLKNYNSLFVSVKFPTAEDIWAVTPMPWQEGRSWAKGIESGISGLNYYFYSKDLNDDDSRSGTAVQFKNKPIRSYARYVPTQYISTILKKYKTIFSSKYAKNNSVFVNIE
jgi:hypothetical protein